MLFYVLIGGVILLGWLIFRHVNGQPAPILIGIIAVSLVVGGVVEWRWRTMEDRYSTATQKLLHRDDTYVVCERLSHAMINVWNREGYVKWTDDGSKPRRADLTWKTCRNIRKWEGSGKTATNLDQVIAVHVLTHETMHLDGHYNEAEAECAAIQHDSQMARLLGATKADGDALARSYLINVYPRMRSDYTSGDCKAGGALDETPNDGQWP